MKKQFSILTIFLFLLLTVLGVSADEFIAEVPVVESGDLSAQAALASQSNFQFIGIGIGKPITIEPVIEPVPIPTPPTPPFIIGEPITIEPITIGVPAIPVNPTPTEPIITYPTFPTPFPIYKFVDLSLDSEPSMEDGENKKGKEGQNFEVSIVNYGNKKANDFTVQLLIDDIPFKDKLIHALGAGKTKTIKFFIPNKRVGLSHRVIIDSSNVIDEIIEDNNGGGCALYNLGFGDKIRLEKYCWIDREWPPFTPISP